MIWFERPVFLLFFIFIPLYVFLRKSGFIRKFYLSLTLGDWEGSSFYWKTPFIKTVSFICVCLIVISFFSAILSAAGFSILKKENYYSGTSSPVVFVIDVSPSMSAPDMNGETRFDSAREGIRTFVEKRPGGSFGLVALASDAAMLVPPTTDRDTFLSRLGALKIGELGDGTAIGMGLAVAVSHLDGIQASSAHVVLLTDGENNSGEINPVTAASFFPTSNISLIIAGLGRRGVSDISYEDPYKGIRYSGKFNSEFDEGSLLKIASAAGGIYVRAENTDSLNTLFLTLEASVPALAVGWTKNVPFLLDYQCALVSLIAAAVAWILRLCFLGGGICI